jgi:hypothetical protein
MVSKPWFEGVGFVLVPFAIFGWLLLALAGNSGTRSVAVASGWLVVTGLLELAVGKVSGPQVVRAALAVFAFLVTSLAAANLGTVPFEEPTPVANKTMLALARQRLGVVARDLDRLPSFGARTGRARVGGCSVDSGDVFQPAATREWNVKGSARKTVATRIGEAMIATGWTGSTTDVDGDRSFTRTYNGWTATATVGSPYQIVPAFVEVHIAGMRPCSLPD